MDINLINIEDNKNNIVVKHQELVHNARYKLSELGIKVVSVLISMIKTSDKDFEPYILNISDFKELIGSNSNRTYEYVDKLTDELMTKFKIGNTKFLWCYQATYVKGGSVVKLKIDPDLKPYLLQLQKSFLQYNVTNILPLRSAYVIRLYEICKDHFEEGIRYKKATKSVQFELKINRMRELFEIPKSYQWSSHIKKLIIEKAVKQFKEKTDIQISYTEQKIGRKVDRIIITVKENNKGSNNFLKNEKTFISYMRKNFINQLILNGSDKNTKKLMKISVSPEGKLYDLKSSNDFDSKRSKEIWNTLYEMAKNDDLICLKQKTIKF